jgi:large subunit ribosomal protein L17
MRHRKTGLKLNRTSSHRNAMFRNMVTSLFKYERIRTTGAKAKEIRRWADHLITLAKRGDLHAMRQALSIIREKTVVYKLFKEAGEKYGKISGGYTRIIKIGRRPGDAAPVSLIELVPFEEPKKKKATKKKGKVSGEKKKKAEGKAALDKKIEKAEKKTAAKEETGEGKDGKSEKKSKKPTFKKAIAEEKLKVKPAAKKAKADKKEDEPVIEKKATTKKTEETKEKKDKTEKKKG